MLIFGLLFEFVCCEFSQNQMNFCSDGKPRKGDSIEVSDVTCSGLSLREKEEQFVSITVDVTCPDKWLMEYIKVSFMGRSGTIYENGRTK